MSPSNGEFSIIYDLTGLATRQAAATPTGLDRGNLRYAQYFLKSFPEHTVFVRQSGAVGVVVNREDASALITYLDAAWSNRTDTEESWSTESIGDAENPDTLSLAFRVNHPSVSDPDYESFFALPFSERFHYLLRNSMQKELGPEFRWVTRFPFALRVAYSLLGSASRPFARFLFNAGQFIGVLAQSRSPSLAFRAAFRKRRRAELLKEHLFARPRRVAEKLYYVNTSQFVGLPFSYLEDLKKTLGVELVFLIHDLLPIHYPEYFIAESNRLLERRIHRMLGLKPILLANSQVTKSHVIEYAAQKGLVVNDVTVAPLGVERHFNGHILAPPGLGDRPYFVMLCTIEARKNHLLVLNIWRDFCRRRNCDVPKLYLVGRRGWESEAVCDMLERCAVLHGNVFEMTDCKDADLVPLLANARALLAPSFSEGWGMPIVESLSLGVPVICSDIPAFRESGQSIPDYIDPLDGRCWTETILAYCPDDSAPRRAQMERIRGFQPPTWEAHFAIAIERILST